MRVEPVGIFKIVLAFATAAESDAALFALLARAAEQRVCELSL